MPNTFPAGRYGWRRQPRRRRPWLGVLLLLVVLGAAAAIAVKLYRQYGNPAYTAQITSHQISDRSATVVFQVTKPAGRPALCGLRARSRDGRDVGMAVVDVPAGAPTRPSSTVTYTLPTTERAYVVDVTRCAAAGAK